MVNEQVIKNLSRGSAVKVKVEGTLVDAQYVGWSDKYDMPLVLVAGKTIPRKIYEICSLTSSVAVVNDDGIEEVDSEEDAVVDINTRFSFLEQLVTMVATGLLMLKLERNMAQPPVFSERRVKA